MMIACQNGAVRRRFRTVHAENSAIFVKSFPFCASFACCFFSNSAIVHNRFIVIFYDKKHE
jgi:hypothetical protein